VKIADVLGAFHYSIYLNYMTRYRYRKLKKVKAPVPCTEALDWLLTIKSNQI